jgi:hypothetical protein
MTQENTDNSQISRKLADLNWEIEPARDLWPDISSKIRFTDRGKKPLKKSMWMPLTLAASVVVAAASLFLAGLNYQKAEDAQIYQAAMEKKYQESQLALIEQQHQIVRAQLATFLQNSNQNADSHFTMEIQALMQNVDLASIEIKNAISVQPNNPDYTSMLMRTYQQEIKILNLIKSYRAAPTLIQQVNPNPELSI